MTYFVDTNIWLYAFIEQDKSKSDKAKTLINPMEPGSLPVLSTQVINEICVNLLKKTHIAERDIEELIVSFYQSYQIVELDQRTLVKASQLRVNYSLSFWDSQIVATALVNDIPLLYSEDMHDGLLIEKRLTIKHPFRQ